MNRKILSISLAVATIFFFSCNNCDKECADEKVKSVVTKDMQEKLTPDAVLDDLLKGNERFVAGKTTNRDLPAQIEATTNDQFPKAVILSCIDSRVPVEYIFDQGIGDVFVARVAGNVENTDLLGSLEYGVGVAGSKLIMVLGHENCGAVKSAIAKVDVGSTNVTALLNEIEPAVQEVKGNRDAKDKEYFKEVIKNNVNQTVDDIRSRSKIIADLEKEGKIKLVAAYYSLHDGKVIVL